MLILWYDIIKKKGTALNPRVQYSDVSSSSQPVVRQVASENKISQQSEAKVNTDTKFSLTEGNGFINTYEQRTEVTGSLEKILNEKYSSENPRYVDGIPVTFDYIHESGGMGSFETFYINMMIGDGSAALYDVVNIRETKITGVPHTSESIKQSTDRSGTPAVGNVTQNEKVVNADVSPVEQAMIDEVYENYKNEDKSKSLTTL